MGTCLVIFLGAVALSLLATPAAARLARRLGIIDRPGPRKIHRHPVPRIGGLAVALVTLVVTSVWVLLGCFPEGLPPGDLGSFGLLLGACTFLGLIGLVDDVYGLPAPVKLTAQLAAAGAICAGGIRLDHLAVSHGGSLDLGWWSWPITILWIVGATNALNLIDGLDGLAGGISAIACAAMAAYALHTNQGAMAVLMLAALGSLTGFLVFNFHPARVFLGDCGTMFLGCLVAAAGVQCASESSSLVGIALPVLVLGVPIYDTFFSILRRLLERRQVLAADRGHIHHRLLELGLGHRSAVLRIHAVTLVAAGLGLLMVPMRQGREVAVFACAWVLLGVFFRSFGTIRLRESLAVFHQWLTARRRARCDERCLARARLQLDRAGNLENWWTTLCAAADELGFTHLRASLLRGQDTLLTNVWQVRAEPSAREQQTVHLSATAPGDEPGLLLRVEGDLLTNGCPESAGRRAAALGRLIGEHGPVRVGARPLAA
jgi:UDP-GlcNAc:undecaprenyl-phosphate GlcNAc-1-phosphate transferase